MLRGKVVEPGEEGVILRRVQMRHLRFEERELQVPHLEPVHDLRMQVQTQSVHQFLDVVDGLLRIPARIHVKQQRAQAELFLGEVRHVGAVDAAAETDEAVMVPAIACPFDLLDLPRQLPRANLVRMPVGQDVLMEVVAVVTPSTGVERDVRVRGVHDAVGADLVAPVRHGPANG